ncbi:MAG TPA: aminotransferase class V-fold PLP-dependent enzyme [Syntrophorhabdaceae bacterium]|nr:aminotransferase class V-fold PLP-dependent enzyme [Syntrophorhabdaceae bacterium]HQM82126.1 aminotransferase class V-fold PLP-dependent enzyme [Syntrophorhabdaceae bacterium]
MIYFDNAATSFPKPQETIDSLNDFVRNVGGNPGRSGHALSTEAARYIFEAREKLAGMINACDSERIIFTQNGTESLNLAILGLLQEKDHVITTSLEHNSVMRPLMFLNKERRVDVSVVQCAANGSLDAKDIKKLIRKETKAIVINHGSNIIGTVQPVGEIKRMIGEITLIVDACQTVGSFPVDIEEDNIDVLCFSCHKSLYGIQGLGAIYMRNGIEPIPLKFGGTGSRSEFIEQPLFLPDRYESGTPNTPGIASLLGGLSFIEKVGIGSIIRKKQDLRRSVIDGLSCLPGIVIYGDQGNGNQLPVISFNIAGKLPSEVGYELNKRAIYTRVGLHCAPLAHKTIGTFPEGTVRVAPGYFTTDDEVALFIEAIKEIAGRT